MKYDKRMRALQYIYDYLVMQHLDHAEVPVSDIVNFHHLHRECSYTFAATMKHVYESGKVIHGFRITGIRISKKEGTPAKYFIELVEGKVGFKQEENLNR